MWRGVYAITDEHLLPTDDILLSKTELALKGGATIIQYRDKSNNQHKKLRQAAALVNLCNHYNVPLIINDDVMLAHKINARGVHLGQSDISLTEARKVLGEKKIIGITCHDLLTLAHAAQQQGANYVAFGACFASPTKPNAKQLNLDVLKQAKQQLNIPVVAIGGINGENAASIIKTGVDMIAVVSALFAHNDVEIRTQLMANFFK